MAAGDVEKSKVNRDYHIEIAPVKYSVPHAFAGQHVDVKIAGDSLTIMCAGEVIALPHRLRATAQLCHRSRPRARRAPAVLRPVVASVLRPPSPQSRPEHRHRDLQCARPPAHRSPRLSVMPEHPRPGKGRQQGAARACLRTADRRNLTSGDQLHRRQAAPRGAADPGRCPTHHDRGAVSQAGGPAAGAPRHHRGASGRGRPVQPRRPHRQLQHLR